MKKRISTEAVVLLAIAGLLGWEAYTLANSIPSDTISEVVWRAVVNQPLVPFLAGLLCGHWFWLPKRCWELLRKR